MIFYDKLSVEKVSIYQEKETLWSIAYRKNDSMKTIIDYMYKDAHIYMKRKKHRCDLITKEMIYYGNTEITKETKNSLVL